MMQNKSIIIGITGGIGTGKSTLVKILKERNHIVIDSDIIARQVVQPGKGAYSEIVDYFGQDILLEDKTINRKKLGRIIFNDEKERKKLNSISHPYILKEIKDRICYYKGKNKLIFVDIPLLIEGLEDLKKHKISFDKIWLVYLPQDIQAQRLMARDNIGYEEAKTKIDSQLPLDEKVKYATDIIYNHKDKAYLRDRVLELLSHIE